MQRFHRVAIPLLALCGGAVFYWADVVWARRLLLLLVVMLVAAATILQLMERCPRCRARLRTSLLLRLPQRCHFCGVSFPSRGPA